MEGAVSIHDALLVPDDGLTAQMLTVAELNARAQERTFTMADLLRMDPDLAREQELARKIRAVLDAPALIEQRAGFAAQLGAALSHYGAGQRQDVQELLGDPWGKLQKGIRIPLSKRGLAQLQKLHPTRRI